MREISRLYYTVRDEMVNYLLMREHSMMAQSGVMGMCTAGSGDVRV